MDNLFDLNIEKVLEHWGVEHAIREIIANALDEMTLTGTKEIEISYSDGVCHIRDYGRGLEMSRNVQSGNTQNLKSMVIQCSFPKRSVAERRKTVAASDQAAVCACAHSRYFAGGSPSGLRV